MGNCGLEFLTCDYRVIKSLIKLPQLLSESFSWSCNVLYNLYCKKTHTHAIRSNYFRF